MTKRSFFSLKIRKSYLIILVILIFTVGYISILSGEGTTRPYQPADYEVEYAVQDLVNDQLNYPASSNYPGGPTILRSDDGWVEVTWKVNASNGFGALVTKPFMVKMRYVEGPPRLIESWEVGSLILP